MIKGVLFQEELHKDPFWMLVACQLVNLTKWQQAEPVFNKIREMYQSPGYLIYADEKVLADLIQPLGLHNRRAASIKSMANMYSLKEPKTAADVMKLPGCGKYAADSWAIFVEGNMDVEPTDVELKGWLERRANAQSKQPTDA